MGCDSPQSPKSHPPEQGVILAGRFGRAHRGARSWDNTAVRRQHLCRNLNLARLEVSSEAAA